ncbi:MAG: outer membrane protein assembly factor BamD, partial [Burkholderiales bacterium]|nr:outer membrane protein assembly factor BamD [Burkholderiales bacterium]
MKKSYIIGLLISFEILTAGRANFISSDSKININQKQKVRNEFRTRPKLKSLKIPRTIPKPQGINKLIKDMEFDEAYNAKNYYKELGDLDMVIKTNQRLITLGGDQAKVGESMIELISTYYSQQKYEKAQKQASEYIEMYPGSEFVKTAKYYEIKCWYANSPISERDQANTLKAIELGKKFLEDYGSETIYKDEIQDVINLGYSKLLDTEIEIANTYLSRYDYFGTPQALQSAKLRLAYAKDKIAINVQNNVENRLSKLEQDINKYEKKHQIVYLPSTGKFMKRGVLE